MIKRMALYLYILKCSDDSYYTGVTNNMDKRLSEHQIGINKSCYTYNKRPVQLVFSELFPDNLYGIEWEKKIKRWTRRKKEALIEGNYNDLHEFSTCKNHTHFSNKIK